MIDINVPVPQGEDLVIPEGGDIHLGDYDEFNKKAALGLLSGVYPGDYGQYLEDEPVAEPADEPAAKPEVEPQAELETAKPQRDALGHFISKSDSE